MMCRFMESILKFGVAADVKFAKIGKKRGLAVECRDLERGQAAAASALRLVGGTRRTHNVSQEGPSFPLRGWRRRAWTKDKKDEHGGATWQTWQDRNRQLTSYIEKGGEFEELKS